MMMQLRSRQQNKQAKNNELSLIINNIQYPCHKYLCKYFAQSNILICEDRENWGYDVWNVIGEELIMNYEIYNILDNLVEIFFMEKNDMIIGIKNNKCQLYNLSKKSITYSTNLYNKICKYHKLKGCQSKLENILCLIFNNMIQFWNLNQDKQKRQQFLKSNVSLLEQKQYIFIIEAITPVSYLMIQNSNRYKLLRRLNIPVFGDEQRISFNGKYLIIYQNFQQTLTTKDTFIDITSMKIKQVIHNHDDFCIDQIHIEPLDIFIKLFRDKIRIYNKECQLINEKINPQRMLNITHPQKLEYNQKQGLTIFHEP